MYSNIEIILWIILFLIVVVGIALFLIFRQPSSIVSPSTPQISCSGLIDNVPEVTDESIFLPCCELDGTTLNQRYYDKMNDWTVINLGSSEIPPSGQVCLDFCSQVQLPTSCITQDTTYQSCLDKLTPRTCTDPALPVARSGEVPFYAVGKGFVSCYECIN